MICQEKNKQLTFEIKNIKDKQSIKKINLVKEYDETALIRLIFNLENNVVLYDGYICHHKKNGEIVNSLIFSVDNGDILKIKIIEYESWYPFSVCVDNYSNSVSLCLVKEIKYEDLDLS